jgi:hypothetical protein
LARKFISKTRLATDYKTDLTNGQSAMITGNLSAKSVTKSVANLLLFSIPDRDYEVLKHNIMSGRLTIIYVRAGLPKYKPFCKDSSKPAATNGVFL